MFSVFDSKPDGLINAQEAGRKGGQAKTKAKVAASRKNGKKSKKGGRPRTRTLGELLLRQPLDRDQHNAIREAVLRLTTREQKWFKEYFGLPQYPDLDVMNIVSHKRKPGAEMQHIIQKFRLMARWLISDSRPRRTLPPKDYIVIRIPKDPHEQDAWERRHPNMPFVATRPKKLYFERMHSFRHLDLLLSKNPKRDFSVEAVRDLEGGRITEKAAEALLEYLKFKHKPS